MTKLPSNYRPVPSVKVKRPALPNWSRDRGNWLERVIDGFIDWRRDRKFWRDQAKRTPEEVAADERSSKERREREEALEAADPNCIAAGNFPWAPVPNPRPPDYDTALQQAFDYRYAIRNGYEPPPPHPLWAVPESISGPKPESDFGSDPEPDAKQRSARSYPRDYEDACALLGLGCDCTRDQLKERYGVMIRKTHTDAGGSNFMASLVNNARDRIVAFNGWKK